MFCRGKHKLKNPIVSFRFSVVFVSYVCYCNCNCSHTERDYRGMALADCWNWGKWGLKERVHMKGGPSLVGFLCSFCYYKGFLACLGWSSRLSAKYLFPYRFHWSITQQAGQVVVPHRLSFIMCLFQYVGGLLFWISFLILHAFYLLQHHQK